MPKWRNKVSFICRRKQTEEITISQLIQLFYQFTEYIFCNSWYENLKTIYDYIQILMMETDKNFPFW